MREIHPLGLVPYAIIMNALAYQVGRKLKTNSSYGSSLFPQISLLIKADKIIQLQSP